MLFHWVHWSEGCQQLLQPQEYPNSVGGKKLELTEVVDYESVETKPARLHPLQEREGGGYQEEEDN